MEKQIIIKHLYSDKTFKIKNIINYLELFIASSNDKVIFNFSINKNQLKIIDEITNLNNLSGINFINKEASPKNYNFNIVSDFNGVIYIINIIENYELCAMIYCNDIKMFLNDNDGDFITINTKHKKYQAIKNKNKLFSQVK